MKYRLLGNSGLRVSEAALGTMTFGDDWGWGAAKDEARKVYDAFRDAGGNFIDTANVYTKGTSEIVPRRVHAEPPAEYGVWPRNTPMPLLAQTRTQPETTARV